MRGLAHEREARVVGNVEPFVAIGGPGISIDEGTKQISPLWRGCGPHPKSAIDVNPRALRASLPADFTGRIESARVHISGLNTNDGAVIDSRQRVSTHAALLVGRNHRNPRPA